MEKIFIYLQLFFRSKINMVYLTNLLKFFFKIAFIIHQNYITTYFLTVEYFISRKYLIKKILCTKYLNLFNDLKLKLTNKDNYIFESQAI